MGVQRGSLNVRQYDRHACHVPARVGVAHGSAGRVVLARTGADGQVDAVIIDFSPGGLGIRSPVFFPVGCELWVQPSGSAPGLIATVRVRRVTMTDRTPTYELGTHFDAGATGQHPLLEALAREQDQAAA